MALLGEGAGAGAPVSKRLGIYGTGDVREWALQRIGGAGGLRQIGRRPKPGRLNFFRPSNGWAKARGKAPYGAGVRHGWGWDKKVMYPCGEKRYVGVKGRGM